MDTLSQSRDSASAPISCTADAATSSLIDILYTAYMQAQPCS